MVSKFKFVRYGHIKKKLALYMPRLNSDGPRKSRVSLFQKAKYTSLGILLSKLLLNQHSKRPAYGL